MSESEPWMFKSVPEKMSDRYWADWPKPAAENAERMARTPPPMPDTELWRDPRDENGQSVDITAHYSAVEGAIDESEGVRSNCFGTQAGRCLATFTSFNTGTEVVYYTLCNQTGCPRYPKGSNVPPETE